MNNKPSVIDGDGHVLEDFEAIAKFLPPPFVIYTPSGGVSTGGVFPPLDHIHSGNFVPQREIGERFLSANRVGADEWLKFLEQVGIELTVLYPTAGLACGKISDPDWAGAVTTAYNNWLAETYLKRSPRFKGMALLPMQDPAAAAAELRRAVGKLGMCGAMLPSNGLKAHLGSKDYWPVYDAANELGCTLAVHGGCHDGMGMDDMNVFAAAHALGHPFGIMIAFAGMLFNDIFERFPRMRVAFLESGVAAYLMLLERCDGSYKGFPRESVNGRRLSFSSGPRVGDYILQLIKDGRIFIGCEGDEPSLAYGIKVFGNQPFLYSSDFPHEVTVESCQEEIEELLENQEIGAADKEAILHHNALRCYRLGA